MLLMMWDKRDVQSHGFVTGCCGTAAKQLGGSWSASARHHEAMHMN